MARRVAKWSIRVRAAQERSVQEVADRNFRRSILSNPLFEHFFLEINNTLYSQSVALSALQRNSIDAVLYCDAYKINCRKHKLVAIQWCAR